MIQQTYSYRDSDNVDFAVEFIVTIWELQTAEGIQQLRARVRSPNKSARMLK